MRQVHVLIPAAMEELDESHAPLGQPARQQAIGGKGPGSSHFGPVHLQDRIGLVREVGQLGDRGLHPEGQLVLRDPRDDLGIADVAVIDRVEPGQVVEHPPPGRGRDAGRIGEIQDRVADRSELHALVRGRQEAAAPEPVVQRLVVGVAGALRDHDDEGRQVVVLAPQAVGHPGADAGPTGQLGPGLEERHGRVVIDRLGVHRLDEAELGRRRSRCAAAAR